MRFLKSEAGAILVWLAASLVLAALLMPWLYDAGMSLALSAKTADYPSIIESVADSAERAKPGRYFGNCLTFSALALLPLLIRRVKTMPNAPVTNPFSLRKLAWPQRLTHLVAGLLIGASCLGALALLLEMAGAAVPRGAPFTAGKFISKACVPAIGAGVIEELLFRGLLLGLWLRSCSLKTACLGSALLYSYVHFLSPPRGMEIADPGAWYAGLEVLASTLGHFTDPKFFITEFATLTLLGLLLAYCRIRTRSLWLPIGIHAGLVFALKTFSMLRTLVPESPLHPWFIGNDLKSGILPITALGLCFALCVAFTRIADRNKDLRP